MLHLVRLLEMTSWLRFDRVPVLSQKQPHRDMSTSRPPPRPLPQVSFSGVTPGNRGLGCKRSFRGWDANGGFSQETYDSDPMDNSVRDLLKAAGKNPFQQFDFRLRRRRGGGQWYVFRYKEATRVGTERRRKGSHLFILTSSKAISVLNIDHCSQLATALCYQFYLRVPKKVSFCVKAPRKPKVRSGVLRLSPTKRQKNAKLKRKFVPTHSIFHFARMTSGQ